MIRVRLPTLLSGALSVHTGNILSVLQLTPPSKFHLYSLFLLGGPPVFLPTLPGFKVPILFFSLAQSPYGRPAGLLYTSSVARLPLPTSFRPPAEPCVFAFSVYLPSPYWSAKHRVLSFSPVFPPSPTGELLLLFFSGPRLPRASAFPFPYLKRPSASRFLFWLPWFG